MTRINDVNSQMLIEQTAEELKKLKEINPPEWAQFAKTGSHKERPPMREDWWYMRSAAVLRSVYNLGPIGVSKLRVKYGGKKNRGFKPEKFNKASGNIIRKVLQQLESAGLIKKEDKGIHKGRITTPQGKSFIDKIAAGISKKEGKSSPKNTEKKSNE